MEHAREFREELRGELPAWQADGILSPGAARALASRYGLEKVEPRRTSAVTAAKDRSGLVAGVAAVLVACALLLALVPSPEHLRGGALLPVASLGAALAATPLALRGDALAPVVSALRSTGRWVFYLAAFAMSFVPIAEGLRLRSAASAGLLAAIPTFLFAAGAVVAGLRRTEVDAHARGEAMLLAATVLAFTAGLFLEGGIGTAVVANLALAFLAAGRIVRGVSWLTRGPFWEGLVVATVLVANRSIDVGVPGWPRAAGAFLVVVAAIAAGLFFERHRAHAPGAARLHAS
jgi:hypothetical protein